MVTSRSAKKKEWTAGVFLYSGRPDPVWDIPERVGKRLQEVWKSLPMAEPQTGLRSAGLGYRGAFLRGPGQREWIAGNGLVLLRTPKGVETRRDDPREFEKILLTSAPKGLLPEGLMEGKWDPNR
jgi:hypothetical protein